MEVLEIVMALLAAFGMLALGWLLFGRLLVPLGVDIPICVIVPTRGDGAGLEQSVNGLLWLAAGKMPGARIMIVNMGLTSAGEKRAQLLARRSGVELCRPEELAGWLD